MATLEYAYSNVLNHKTGGGGGVAAIIWGAEVFPNVFETERSGTGGQNKIRLYNFGNLTLKMVREVREDSYFFRAECNSKKFCFFSILGFILVCVYSIELLCSHYC